MLTQAALALVMTSATAVTGANQPMICWSQRGKALPRYSMWNGTNWSAASESPTVGNEPTWVIARECPTREEHACLTIDYDKDVNVNLYTGSSWGGVTEVCSDTDNADWRCADMAYSQASGTLLIAYWSKSSSAVGYRTSSGGAVSSHATLALPSTTKLNFLRLYPKPGSDEVVLLALNDSDSLYAAVWSGSSWGAVTTIETSIEEKQCEGFCFAYESSSATGLLVYCEKNVKTPRYRTYASGSWSGELSLPSIGADGRWVRLAPNPTSDQVACAILDDKKDVNVCIWSGSGWGPVTDVEKNTGYTDRRVFDIAYSGTGGSCLLVYGKNGHTSVRYRTLSGSAWSSAASGPSVGDKIMCVQITPDSNGTDLWVLCSDESDDLSVLRYSGGTLALTTTLESSLGGNYKTEQFMLSMPMSAGTSRKVVSWQHAKPE